MFDQCMGDAISAFWGLVCHYGVPAAQLSKVEVGFLSEYGTDSLYQNRDLSPRLGPIAPSHANHWLL